MQGPKPIYGFFSQSAPQIVNHQQMHQNRLFLYLPFYKKNLQYSTIIRINLIESNKKFTAALITCNKLSVNMHIVLLMFFHSLWTKVTSIILFKARLAKNY